jgi:hypothetical protein
MFDKKKKLFSFLFIEQIVISQATIDNYIAVTIDNYIAVTIDNYIVVTIDNWKYKPVRAIERGKQTQKPAKSTFSAQISRAQKVTK